MFTLYTALTMKTSLQKTFTRGLSALKDYSLVRLHVGQSLVRRTLGLDCVKWNCVSVPASFLVTENCLRPVHNCMYLKAKDWNGYSIHDKARVQERSSSTFTSTAKWDSQRQNFVENENEYFHSYLKSVDEYQQYFLPSLQSSETDILSDETVVTFLQETQKDGRSDRLLSLLAHWSGVARKEGSSVLLHQSFSETVKLLQRRVKRFSLEEILQSMAHLNNLDLRQTIFMTELRRHRILLSKAFDQACTRQIEKMEVRDLLLAADFFYSVRGSLFADFIFLMCQRMKLSLPTMTKAELILVLFHASMMRKPPANLVHTVLNHLHPSHLNSLTLQELAIVNLAHYKTQSVIKHPAYFSALGTRLKADEDLDVDPVCLGAVLKYHESSVKRRKDWLLPQFSSTVRGIEGALVRRVAGLSSEALMRVFSLYSALDLMSEDLFMAVVDRIVCRGVRDWRVKDAAKVVQILSDVPLGSERKRAAVDSVLEDLQRKGRRPEVQDHPHCLLQIALALTFCGRYPHWLLELVFGPAAQRYFEGSKIDYYADLYHVSQSVGIEDTLYEGPVLQSDRYPRLYKKKVYTKLMQSAEEWSTTGCGMEEPEDCRLPPGDGLSRRDWNLLDLMNAMGLARPDASPVPTFCLPHFHIADVEVVHKTKPGNQDEDGSSSDNLQYDVREAVVLHGNNAYQTVRCRDGNMVPMLREYHATRVRQLRALGTHVTEVPYAEFQSSTEKCRYLLAKFQEQDRLRHNVGQK